MAQLKTHGNEKRLSKRDPVRLEIYQNLITTTETRLVRSNNYTTARLRVTFCLLTITGISISKLLSLKVYQVKTLLEKGWIKIYCSKRGSAGHKAYLSNQGKHILKSRQKDFDLLFF